MQLVEQRRDYTNIYSVRYICIYNITYVLLMFTIVFDQIMPFFFLPCDAIPWTVWENAKAYLYSIVVLLFIIVE